MLLMPIPAIILAAGASRRLGQPKQLVIIGGETLLDRTIRVAHEAAYAPIFVVLGANQKTISSTAKLDCTHVIRNEDWQIGISTSIQSGIREVLQLTPLPDSALILVCDQPYLSAEHLVNLRSEKASRGDETIVVSGYAQVIGIPAIFPSSQFAELLKLEGDQGARSLLRTSTCSLAIVPFPDGEIDVDLPSDLSNL
jgi:molybdenum cofactor cytidylyltransferase